MEKKAKNIKEMCIEGVNNRLGKMLAYREEFLNDVENCHVTLMKGNSKTGEQCYTVSLIPIVDCPNCSKCSRLCYDIRNVCLYPAVQKDRAKNSAIHMADPERYWNEISLQVKARFVTQLRINVGGDLNFDDFKYISIVAKENPKCQFLFFTKTYNDINLFLNENCFPDNVHPVMSVWEGVEFENHHNLPTSHLLYADGRTTAQDFEAKFCGGNCTECYHTNRGCWTMKKGEAVIFPAH